MVIFKQIDNLQKYLQKLKATGAAAGFIPTMGALHEGHISLVKKSKEVSDQTICSIFVNPTQFTDADDFKKYPVSIEHDVFLLEKAGCDILFLPGVNEIYPGGNMITEKFELGYLENILEGKYRPGHFQGVCMVVKRLLQIIEPASLFVGQKDFQQCLVLQKLLALMQAPVKLIIGNTSREEDGLARSSRNLRLNAEERKLAPEIYHALLLIKEKLKPGSLLEIKQFGKDFLTEKGFKVDYVEIAYAGDLQLADYWKGGEPVVILAAAHLNNVRLIDNVIN